MLEKIRGSLRHRVPRNPLPVAGGDLREAAVLMAIIDSPEPEVVFIKRADHLNSHSGQVGFPGGMWEPVDRDLIQTALRESEEEIALPRDRVEILAELEPEVTLYSVRVTPFVGVIPEGLSFVPEPAELDAVFQAPLRHLLDPANHTSARFSTSVGTFDAPCINFQEYCIWGVTYRIMVNMFRDVLDFDPGNEIGAVQPAGV